MDGFLEIVTLPVSDRSQVVGWQRQARENLPKFYDPVDKSERNLEPWRFGTSDPGSKGERIYHVPGQENYGRTRISTSKGERWFCSEADARAAGWRRARR